MRSFTVRDTIRIAAPIERCWALSTRIELVQKTLGMTPVAGVTHGSIGENSRVTWRGWKFGLPTEHHTLITQFEPPHAHFIRLDGHVVTHEAFFQDTQERGRFASFQHDHHLREEVDGERLTVLRDEVRFALGFSVAGDAAAVLLVRPLVRRLVQERFEMIKGLAEGDGWHAWMDEPAAA